MWRKLPQLGVLLLLLLLAETGQFEVVRSLVLKGHANMHHLTIPDCATALFFACQTGRENILRFFLRKWLPRGSK